jgi:hypothetical protein
MERNYEGDSGLGWRGSMGKKNDKGEEQKRSVVERMMLSDGKLR